MRRLVETSILFESNTLRLSFIWIRIVRLRSNRFRCVMLSTVKMNVLMDLFFLHLKERTQAIRMKVVCQTVMNRSIILHVHIEKWLDIDVYKNRAYQFSPKLQPMKISTIQPIENGKWNGKINGRKTIDSTI